MNNVYTEQTPRDRDNCILLNRQLNPRQTKKFVKLCDIQSFGGITKQQRLLTDRRNLHIQIKIVLCLSHAYLNQLS